MTFTTLLTLWKKRRHAELSFKAAEDLEPMFTRWRKHFGAMEIAEIVPAHIEAYRILRDDGRGGSSLNKERTELTGIFDFAVKLVEISRSPVTTWGRTPEVIQKTYVVLAPDEEFLLCRALNEAGHEDLAAYVRFSIQTGLRQGTIRAMEQSWLNYETSVLTVPARFMKNRKQLTIPLSWKAVSCIDGATVDTFGSGKWLMLLPSHQKIHRLIREAAARAGLPAALSPHDFRRTWVARMRDAGADMLEVMRLGGWSGPTALLTHYFGEVPEKRARELLNAV